MDGPKPTCSLNVLEVGGGGGGGHKNCRHWLIELRLSMIHCFFHFAMYVIHNLVFV